MMAHGPWPKPGKLVRATLVQPLAVLGELYVAGRAGETASFYEKNSGKVVIFNPPKYFIERARSDQPRSHNTVKMYTDFTTNSDFVCKVSAPEFRSCSWKLHRGR